jgi:hypothetical protein
MVAGALLAGGVCCATPGCAALLPLPHAPDRLSVYRQGLKVAVFDGVKQVEGRLGSGAPGNSLAAALTQFSTAQGVGVQDCVVQVKDLGPQFSYRGVFLVEYFGPIAIMAAFAARPAVVYGPDVGPLTPAACWAVALWIAHFVKREVWHGVAWCGMV